MNEMFSGIIVALLSGIALIYSVMVLLFKSVFKPLVIMFSLPLSFTGAFIALLIFGKQIDMPVMIATAVACTACTRARSISMPVAAPPAWRMRGTL